MIRGTHLSAEELLQQALSLLSADVVVFGSDGCIAGQLGSSSGLQPLLSAPAGSPQLEPELQRVLSGSVGEVAFRAQRQLQPVDVRARALRDEQGKVTGALGVVTPATERAALERALRLCEARLGQFVDTKMLGVLFWEPDGAITGANDALLQLLGYTREELKAGQLDWRALTPSEYQGRDDAAIREINERGACTPFEKEYVRKDGRRVPILMGCASFGPGQGGVSFVVDESARKAQEQLRREAEALLRHTVNHAPFVLWAIDAQGVFTLSEGQGLAALGLRPGQVVGMSAFEFYKDAPQILEGLRLGLSGDDFTQTVELNGRLFETRTFHVSDVNGAAAGLVGLSLDVTERQRAEAERLKLQAKLLEVQKLESLGLMAGGIAHDFNNILTVILGNASNALYSLPEDSPVRLDIEATIAAAQRAADLTRQMLAYSGRARFEVKPLDLSHQVREIAALVATTMPGKVQLRLELAELPAVLADGAQFQQVIMNLVINAAEAIGDGAGQVLLATECRSIGPDEARALSPDEPLEPGRYVFLRVSDTGCGMDADTVTKIFDPFFTTKFTGRGLGLAAVLGIVRAHKGAVLVASTPGKGSTFTVVIPSTEQRVEREQRGAERYLGKGLALLVDDDATVRQTVRKMLIASGFSVIEAADGRRGVRAVDEHPGELSLVLLDLTMPEMDGAEALRSIRERSDVPVILMSGYNELEATRRLAASRFQAFLQKPFSSEQLASKLRLVLQRHTLSPRASSGNADERTA